MKKRITLFAMMAFLISSCTVSPAIIYSTITLERRGTRYVTRKIPETSGIRKVSLDLTSGDAALVAIGRHPVLYMDMIVEVITALPLNELRCVDLNQSLRDVWRSGGNYSQEQKIAWQQTKDNLDQYRSDFQNGQPWSFGKTDSLIKKILANLPTREFNCDLEPGEFYKISESERPIKTSNAHKDYGPAMFSYVSSLSIIKSETGEPACVEPSSFY